MYLYISFSLFYGKWRNQRDLIILFLFFYTSHIIICKYNPENIPIKNLKIKKTKNWGIIWDKFNQKIITFCQKNNNWSIHLSRDHFLYFMENDWIGHSRESYFYFYFYFLKISVNIVTTLIMIVKSNISINSSYNYFHRK